MKLNKKIVMIVGGVLLVLFVLAGWMLMNKKTAVSNNNNQPASQEEVIPTIDSSVKVDLTSLTGGHDVSLSVANIPSGTTSIDYELSYQTAQQGLQGVIGTITTDGKSTFEKKLTLGTCSSGTCVYHQVVGKIKLTLKFSSDSGEKIFEKEYGL